MLVGGMGGVAFAEQTIASGLVVAFIAVIPLLLVLINVAFGVYPRRSELLAFHGGSRGVLMLTQGSGIRGSPAGLLAIGLGTTSWALGSVLSQRRFPLASGATGFASECLCGVRAVCHVALRGESWHCRWCSAPVGLGVIRGLGSLIGQYCCWLDFGEPRASYSLVIVGGLCLGVTCAREVVSRWEWLRLGVVMVGIVLLLNDQRRSKAPVRESIRHVRPAPNDMGDLAVAVRTSGN